MVDRTGEGMTRSPIRAHEICRLVSYADTAEVTDNPWGER
jgi:hypothetical protein